MVLTNAEQEALYQLCIEFSERLVELGATSSVVIACSTLGSVSTGDCYAIRGSDFEVRDALRRRLEYMDAEVTMQIGMDLRNQHNPPDDLEL